MDYERGDFPMGAAKGFRRTMYGTNYFLSEHEAQWGALWDLFRLPGWAHEPERENSGFDLGNGERYIPDFYVPGLSKIVLPAADYPGLYVEIKHKDCEDSDFDKAKRFSAFTSFPILLLRGRPADIRAPYVENCRLVEVGVERWVCLTSGAPRQTRAIQKFQGGMIRPGKDADPDFRRMSYEVCSDRFMQKNFFYFDRR